MHRIGRWEKVRELGPMGWGRPFMLDRKWGRLLPHTESGEWWKSPSGLWVPTIRGGSFAGTLTIPRTYVGVTPGLSSPSLVSHNLSNNYVAGTGGNAIAARMMWPISDTLNALYFYLVSYAGTAANVTDLNWEVRKGTSIPDTSAPGLVASGTFNPNSATGWLVISGLSVALTANQGYFLIVGDANGNGTDFARVANTFFSDPQGYFLWQAVSTVGGYTTRNAQASAAVIVAQLASGSVLGSPYSTSSSGGSSSAERGFKIPTALALKGGLKIWGLLGDGAQSTTITGVRVWSGTAGPGGSPDATGTCIVYGITGNPSNQVGALFGTPYTLLPSTQYRITLTFSGAANSLGKLSIGTGADAVLRSAMFGGGWHHTIESGGVWSDDQDSCPYATLVVEDLVAAGGSLALVVSDGLR